MEACKRDVRVEISMHNVLIVQMDQQFEFLITLGATLANFIAKEYHLLPFPMLSSAEHA